MNYDFRDALLDAARDTVGTRETSTNSGPEIDQWLEYVYQPPGKPWCQAWVCSMHRIAAVHCDVPNPCPRTAGALRLWELADRRARVEHPFPGCVFVLDTGERGGAGHVGIVEATAPNGTITTIEGNTNEAGSREGNAVARHTWIPKNGARGVLIGYLNLSELVPANGLPPTPFG